VTEDYQGIGERRKRTLTEDDIDAIVEASQKACNPCPNGLTQDEAIELRAFARWLAQAKNTIGKMVLYAIIAGAIALTYLGSGKFKGQ
jgi:hypothetical protein